MVAYNNAPPNLDTKTLRRLHADVHRQISDYTAILVLEDKRVASGTFVNCCGFDGILTAHHVSKEVFKPENTRLGLSVGSYPHRLYVKTKTLEHVILGEYNKSTESVGPDLSFIIIRDVRLLGLLRSRKSFYCLGNKNLAAFQAPLNRMPWAVAGSPGEFIQHRGQIGAPDFALKASNFVGEAAFLSLIQRNDFDYVELDVTAAGHGFPSDYKGVSGGGIWLLAPTIGENEDPETIAFLPFLAGVAFYEDPIDGHKQKMLIRGHGFESIYRRTVEAFKHLHAQS